VFHFHIILSTLNILSQVFLTQELSTSLDQLRIVDVDEQKRTNFANWRLDILGDGDPYPPYHAPSAGPWNEGDLQEFQCGNTPFR
jgi:hypothetical protein